MVSVDEFVERNGFLREAVGIDDTEKLQKEYRKFKNEIRQKISESIQNHIVVSPNFRGQLGFKCYGVKANHLYLLYRAIGVALNDLDKSAQKNLRETIRHVILNKDGKHFSENTVRDGKMETIIADAYEIIGYLDALKQIITEEIKNNPDSPFKKKQRKWGDVNW